MAVAHDKTRIMITLTKELKEELEAEAQQQNRNLSNYLLTVILNRKT